MIRKAYLSEARVIRDMINSFAQQDLLLPLSLSEIYEHLRDFFVFTDTNDSSGFPVSPGNKNNPSNNNTRIIGLSALYIVWEDLAEIRSLAVLQKDWRKGIGSALVKACLEEAKKIGVKKVFCLTYNRGFFSSLGFKEIDKSMLPHKVWADCVKCTKFPDCGELAMIYDI